MGRKHMDEARKTNLLTKAKKEKAAKRRLDKENADKARAAKLASAEAKASGASTASASAPKTAVDGPKPVSPTKEKAAMRKMKVKIPEKPQIGHSLGKVGRPSIGGQMRRDFSRETSAGLTFTQAGEGELEAERKTFSGLVERKSMGPTARPALKMTSSIGGRIS